ncbi:DUF6551 family protein [Nocardia sp. NPDC051832]|uniref:DUF6551 family protein n=1 Tax=Nocardia sp. NPDC051832 TaxID=3155673 RepID=UPI00342ED896
MPEMTALLDRPETLSVPDVFVDAIPVTAMFVDPSYQRELDLPRVRHMVKNWDRRLVGVVEVSDRGPRHPQGRYALINGQHRWAAAGRRDPGAVMVANVRTGLSVTQEAILFHQIDANTRRLTTWDRWHSREAAGELVVLDIKAVTDSVGLKISMTPTDGNIRCTATLERVCRLGGTLLLGNTLRLILQAWGRRLDAVDAPLVTGLSLFLHTYSDAGLDYRRLVDVLVDFLPGTLKGRAVALREIEKNGPVGKYIALVVLAAYNSGHNPKLARELLERAA